MASPEGSYETNQRLAIRRGKALGSWLHALGVADSLISYVSEAVAWDYLGTLADSVALSSSDLASVRLILDRTPHMVAFGNRRTIDSRVGKLRTLAGGRPWRTLYGKAFPKMRSARADIETSVVAPPMTLVDSCHNREKPDTAWLPSTIHVPDTSDSSATSPDTPTTWQRHLYIKTNIVAWAFLIANIAAEIDIAPHWSVSLAINTSMWNYFKSTRKYRTLAFSPEARYWPRHTNTGFFAAAHLGMAYYNVASGGTYRTQDHNGHRPALGGGMAVGVRIPVGRGSRWLVETMAGVGAYSLYHDKFHNRPNGLLAYSEHKTYIGLDQLTLSLCYTFNLSKKK